VGKYGDGIILAKLVVGRKLVVHSKNTVQCPAETKKLWECRIPSLFSPIHKLTASEIFNFLLLGVIYIILFWAPLQLDLG